MIVIIVIIINPFVDSNGRNLFYNCVPFRSRFDLIALAAQRKHIRTLVFTSIEIRSFEPKLQTHMIVDHCQPFA